VTFPKPELLPPGRDHLDADDRSRLLRFDLLVADGRFERAMEIAEDLFFEATDAHRKLYHGLVNALTAVRARELGKRRGAREIAVRTRAMLAPLPRRSLGFDLDALADSVDRFVTRGDGQVLLLRQG
jgi:hypothetical protein